MPADTPSTSSEPSPEPSPLRGLVPLREAAAACGRAVPTLRTWLRAGRLEGVRERPEDPASRVLVELAAVLRVAAELDPEGSHGEPPPASPGLALPPRGGAGGGEEVAALRAALSAAEALAAERAAGLADLRAAVAREREHGADLAAAERRRADDLAAALLDSRAEVERARAELEGARAELEALRASTGLPWWRRLLSG